MSRDNIAHTSKRCLAQVQGRSFISLFAKSLFSYPHWNSSKRKLKWMSMPIYVEKIIFNQITETIEGDSHSNEIKSINIKSNWGLFRLYPYVDKIEDDNLLPTPLASDGEKGGQIVSGKKKKRPSGNVYSSSLQDLAKSELLPTPTEMDSKGNVTDRGYFNLTDFICKVYSPIDKDNVGGTNMLNPEYVGEMMGFPAYWTLEPFLLHEEKEKG